MVAGKPSLLNGNILETDQRTEFWPPEDNTSIKVTLFLTQLNIKQINISSVWKLHFPSMKKANQESL